MNSGRSRWPACIQQLREQRATLGRASTKVRRRQVLAGEGKVRVRGDSQAKAITGPRGRKDQCLVDQERGSRRWRGWGSAGQENRWAKLLNQSQA